MRRPPYQLHGLRRAASLARRFIHVLLLLLLLVVVVVVGFSMAMAMAMSMCTAMAMSMYMYIPMATHVRVLLSLRQPTFHKIAQREMTDQLHGMHVT